MTEALRAGEPIPRTNGGFSFVASAPADVRKEGSAFDLPVEVPAVHYRDLSDQRPGEPSAAVRERVVRAREIREFYRIDEAIQYRSLERLLGG